MKVFFLTLISLCFFDFCHAQSTTETEYNYMKRGYRQIEEAGLDIKNGYKATVLNDQQYDSEVKITYTLLTRANNTIAGLIVKTVSTAAFGSGKNYYCIPAVSLENAQSFGWKEFYNDVNSMTGTMRFYLMQFFTYQYMYQMSKQQIKQ